VLDFTSALYLGLRHESGSLRPWAQLTAGVPAALATPALSRTVAAGLAALVGAERATLARSTLHAFWDLFGILPGDDTAIYVDASAYPIARWGVERAAARGAPVQVFAHHDPADLWRWLTANAVSRRRPLVVVDGLCPGCGALENSVGVWSSTTHRRSASSVIRRPHRTSLAWAAAALCADTASMGPTCSW